MCCRVAAGKDPGQALGGLTKQVSLEHLNAAPADRLRPLARPHQGDHAVTVSD